MFNRKRTTWSDIYKGTNLLVLIIVLPTLAFANTIDYAVRNNKLVPFNEKVAPCHKSKSSI